MTLTISPEVAGRLERRAQAEGLTAEGWIRRLVERELDQSEEEDGRPVSEMIDAIWADMPDEVRAALPKDGASEHDRYIYGWPKRNR